MHTNFRLAVRLNACATLQRKRAPCRKTTWASSAAHTSCRSYGSRDTAYGRAFAAARDQPEHFWAEAAQDVHWFRPWSQTLHVQDPVFPNWWVNECHSFHPGGGGRCLVCFGCGYVTLIQFETATEKVAVVGKTFFLKRKLTDLATVAPEFSSFAWQDPPPPSLLWPHAAHKTHT